MANICDNRFYFSCENNFDDYIKKFENLFENYLDGEFDVADMYGTGGCLDGYFNSKWTFPTSLFENFFDPNGEEDGVFFRCLSEEYGCGYIGFNMYTDGAWRPEQCIDVL